MIEAINVITYDQQVRTQEYVDYDDIICLEYSDRCRRRAIMASNKNKQFLLNLPYITMLKSGDILELSDKTYIMVQAANQDIVEIRIQDAQVMLQLVWKLGNINHPIEIYDTVIRTFYDNVIEQEFKPLGAVFVKLKAPFTPIMT